MKASMKQLVEAWSQVLKLSLVRPDETICILTRKEIYEENLAAAEFALELIGAKFFKIEPSLSGHDLADNKVVMAAMTSADMIIDFLGIHVLRKFEQEIVRESGTRLLYVIEPPDTLLRMMPSEAEKAEVKAAEKLLSAARTMKITSPHGTDFTASFGEYRVQAQWGYSDEPAHWDHWPSGFLVRWPNEGSANGRFVLAPGDMVFPLRSYIQTEVVIDIRDGYVERISGGVDADLIRNFMERYQDREAFAMSHLGWGLSRKCDWGALHLVDKSKTNGNDGRAFRGNFMFSTGPNTDAGGKRNTLCHLDIPMRGCTVELDGVAVVRNGEVL
jgi:2,5-dihydroxypyridine 5,6-dioxygenase